MNRITLSPATARAADATVLGVVAALLALTLLVAALPPADAAAWAVERPSLIDDAGWSTFTA